LEAGDASLSEMGLMSCAPALMPGRPQRSAKLRSLLPECFQLGSCGVVGKDLAVKNASFYNTLRMVGAAGVEPATPTMSTYRASWKARKNKHLPKRWPVVSGTI